MAAARRQEEEHGGAAVLSVVSSSGSVGEGIRAMLEPELRVAYSAARLRELPQRGLDGATVIVNGTEASRLLSSDIDPAHDYLPAALLLLSQEIDTATLRRARQLRESETLPNLYGVAESNAAKSVLVAALQAVAAGFFVEPAATHNARASELTGRELELLPLLARGLLNKEIAYRLGISANTVKYHLSSLYGKLGAGTRLEAVRAAAERGLILL